MAILKIVLCDGTQLSSTIKKAFGGRLYLLAVNHWKKPVQNDRIDEIN